MKKAILLIKITFLLLFINFSLKAQPDFQLQNLNDLTSKAAFGIGYGSHGILFRFDMSVKKYNKSNTRVYIDFASEGYTFSQSQFKFDSVNYSSSVNIISFGIGIEQEFIINHFTITPYLGLRYYYARFTDGGLINAIGESGMQRFETDPYGNVFDVGPVVDNGYGDIVGVELGSRFGYKINKYIELGCTIGISPASFDSGATLFGKYWGESLYTNTYYINLPTVNAEGYLRINFGVHK